LADLKSKYDKELKKVGVKTASSGAPTGNPASVSTGSAPRATKGIAKTLPMRKEVKVQAPAQEADERVGMPDSTTPSSSDEGASQNDAQSDLKIKLVPSAEARDKTAASSEGPGY
jgi:hypothetical protein